MESIKATVKFKIEYPRAVRSVFLDTREQLSSISYTNLVRLYSQESMHPVVGPWSISGQNWPLTTDRQIHDPLWWPLTTDRQIPPDTWSTLVTMLMTTIIFVVRGLWSVVRRAKKNWPYSPENYIVYIFLHSMPRNKVQTGSSGHSESVAPGFVWRSLVKVKLSPPKVGENWKHALFLILWYVRLVENCDIPTCMTRLARVWRLGRCGIDSGRPR